MSEGSIATQRGDPAPAAATDGLWRRCRDRARRAVYRSRASRLASGGHAPTRLGEPFPTLDIADQALTAALLDGRYLLAGRPVAFGQQPWGTLPRGERLARALHEFGWLLALRADGGEAARARARQLVESWLHAHGRWTAPAWRPDILGRRLVHWLAAADFLLAGAEDAWRDRLLASISDQARHLLASGRGDGDDDGAFAIALGQLAAALCVEIGAPTAALARLEAAIARQIAVDGGHARRDPARQVAVLRDLIAARAALVRVGQTSRALETAIQRMAPFARAMRHGDGGLALFHGAKEGDRAVIDSVLAASGVGQPALDSAAASGFQRLAAGRGLVIIDVGAPPPGEDGHLAPLAFEMSHGRERVIVNCGAFQGDHGEWRAALRSTAAHSTLSIEGANAGDAGWAGWTRRRRVTVACVRDDDAGAIWLEASHDGFRPRFGVVHKRRLYLDATGEDLRGEDAILGRRGRRFHVRFHLHPKVKASLVENRAAVLLRTASGAAFRFVCSGGTLALEDSVYLGIDDQPRRCEQIVISGVTQRDGAHVKWALRRQGATA